MEYLHLDGNPEQESALERRRRMAYLVAAGARLNNRALFGVGGSGLYIENPQNQVMQV